MHRRKPFEDYDPSRFISGVYNYCDRWCERCRFNTRCLVYHEEQQRTAEHILNDENPHDLGVVLSDVTEQFQYSLELLQKMADEAGIDPEDAPGDPDEEDDWDELFADDEDQADVDTEFDELDARHAIIKRDPLIEHTTDVMNRVEKVAERVRDELPVIGQVMANQIMQDARRGVEPDGETILAGLQAVRDAYETLCHYRFFIVVKLMRALSSLRQADHRTGILADHSKDDAYCTAKLVDDCLAKLIDALWRIGEFRREWLDLSMPLAADAESVRQTIAERFPGFEEAIRPGFDTEDEETT